MSLYYLCALLLLLYPSMAGATAVDKDVKLDDHLDVCLRVKPLSIKKKNSARSVENTFIVDDTKNELQVTTRKNYEIYKFSAIFTDKATHETIFNRTVDPVVNSFLQGKDCLFLAYGTTSAGKTHSLQGGPTNPGLLPRVLKSLFQKIHKVDSSPKYTPAKFSNVKLRDEEHKMHVEKVKNAILARYKKNQNVPLDNRPSSSSSSTDLHKSRDAHHSNENGNADLCGSIWISIIEVYLEKPKDLLRTDDTRVISIVRDTDGKFFIKGQNELNVSCWEEADIILRYANKHRTTSSTFLNQSSSRSHCLYQIRLVQEKSDCELPNSGPCKVEQWKCSTFIIGDLAGAERVEKAGSTGESLQETLCINNSLVTLGRCIKSLSVKGRRKHPTVQVPFRDSKLTMILQPLFSDVGPKCLLVHISQDPSLISETRNALEFSALATTVVVREFAPPAHVEPRDKNFNSDSATGSHDEVDSADFFQEISEPETKDKDWTPNHVSSEPTSESSEGDDSPAQYAGGTRRKKEKGTKRRKQTDNSPSSMNYDKLVAPPNVRSPYWEFFGIPANRHGQMLTKKKAVCKVCNESMSFSKSSNLGRHLMRKHIDVFDSIQKSPGNVTDKKFVATPSNRSGHAQEESEQNMENDKITKQPKGNINTATASSTETATYLPVIRLLVAEETVHFVTSELVEPSFIQSHGFTKFIQKINPEVLLPTKKQLLEELIPQKFNEIKTSMKTELSHLKEYSISVEEWTGSNKQQYITLFINFVQTDTLVTKVLKTLEIVKVTPNAIRHLFDSWGITADNIIAVVVATETPIVLEAFEPWAEIPCFSYTIHKAVCATFELPLVQNLLEKCRTKVASHSTLNIPSECTKNWASTLEMLQALVDNKNKINNIRTSDDLKFSKSDWDTINILTESLSPLKMAIQTLQEDNHTPAAIINPLCWQLVHKQLKITGADSQFAKELKTIIISKLLLAYNNPPLHHFLLTATKLDPRFKKLFYLTQEEVSTFAPIFKKIVDQYANATCKLPEVSSPSAKKTAMETFLGAAVVQQQDMSAKDKTDLEISQYDSENSLPLRQNPWLWWGSAKARYPTLATFGQALLCIPACIPLGKAALDQRKKFEQQRASLSVDIIDKMLFLNGNYS